MKVFVEGRTESAHGVVIHDFEDWIRGHARQQGSDVDGQQQYSAGHLHDLLVPNLLNACL